MLGACARAREHALRQWLFRVDRHLDVVQLALTQDCQGPPQLGKVRLNTQSMIVPIALPETDKIDHSQVLCQRTKYIPVLKSCLYALDKDLSRS